MVGGFSAGAGAGVSDKTEDSEIEKELNSEILFSIIEGDSYDVCDVVAHW